MGPIRTLDDLIDMLRRRKRMFFAIFFLGSVISIVWALAAPHVYQSSETIQVKLPKIASGLASSTVEGSSMRRLQLIEQQLLARKNLIDLIEKYDLYAGMTGLKMSEKVDLLRASITITAVAVVREGYDGNRGISSMTFTVAMGDPADAQAIAREFSDRTRALAAAQRREQTREALDFFLRQEKRLVSDIAALERDRARFKAANDLALRGSLQFRQDEIVSLNQQIVELDREIIATRLARARVSPAFRAPTIAREKAELDAALENLNTQHSQLNDQRNALRASLQTSPEIDRELDQFERRLAQLESQLELTVARRIEAEVGFSLEVDGRGEGLTTLEAAELPEYPISSSRAKVAAVGGIFSMMLALVAAFLLEIRYPVLRTAQQMARETGLTPVISIPDLSPPQERKTAGQAWRNILKAGQKIHAAWRARKNAGLN